MSYRKLAALSLILLLILLSGCGVAQKQTAGTAADQVIRYNLGAEPETLDPAKMTGVVEGTIANALFEGLVRYDDKNIPQPAMAAEWHISEDGLVYTFKLREAKWSNGAPVTAEDFRFSWLRVLSPDTASDYAGQLFYIKGAEEYNGGRGTAEDVAIKAKDSHTLEVTLKAPASQFLGLTAFWTLLPLNSQTITANPDWYTSPQNYVGNGPFLLQTWEHKQKITLVKNPNYWDAQNVKLDKLEMYLIEDDNTAYAMYKTGRLDFLERIPAQEIALKKNDPDYCVLPDISTELYWFNTKRAPLDNPTVRRALAMSIDRAAIVEHVTQAGEEPAYAWVPFGFKDEPPTSDFREKSGNRYFTEDAEAARKLLAEAGYPGGQGFPQLTLQFNNNLKHRKTAEAIQEMWRRNLGIDIVLAPKEWQVYIADQAAMNYDISRSGWGPDYLDPMTFMDVLVSDGGNNLSGWSNLDYDSLIAEAKGTGNNSLRMKAMHDAEDILMAEMPVMPLYFYVNDNLIRENIKGIIVLPFGTYADFKNAYVE
ncbi:peptide ABC transporter substrate-binding protein [Phosphitispora sp. TUW77]|uniref:peptide ABC transporter substrate-binding protein n=1 Tax=Phosphitispora sp. TUW77 TaxID=3152361 RepID=UPI003AB3F027